MLFVVMRPLDDAVGYAEGLERLERNIALFYGLDFCEQFRVFVKKLRMVVQVNGDEVFFHFSSLLGFGVGDYFFLSGASGGIGGDFMPHPKTAADRQTIISIRMDNFFNMAFSTILS